MRLRWPLRRRDDSADPDAAAAALDRARAERAAVEERWPSVRQVTQSLRDARGANHLAEAITAALRSGER